MGDPVRRGGRRERGAGWVDAALDAVPRVRFLPPDQQSYAERDAALPIGHGVTNSQPSTVRAMLELLGVRPGDRVLDVGCGSCWTTALLARLTGPEGEVVAVERIPAVLAQGQANLATVYDDERFAPVGLHLAEPGVLGVPARAPYDRILVSAAADALPSALVDQLAEDGVMVVPVRGVMLRVRITPDGPVVAEHGRYVFVPLIED